MLQKAKNMARKKAATPKRKKKVSAVQMKSEPEDVKAVEEPEEMEEGEEKEEDKPEGSEVKVPPVSFWNFLCLVI